MKQLYTIEVFDRKRLRWIAGIKWSDKISNHQLMQKVKLPSLCDDDGNGWVTSFVFV